MSDKNNKGPVAKQQSVTQQALMYSAPLPPASEFAGYDATLPGAGDRILSLVEKEMQHRHQAENKLIKIAGRGQIFGLIVSVFSLGAIALSIYFKQPIASIPPAIIAITGLASVFINQKNK